MKLSISEILKKCSEASKKEEKIAILRKYDSTVLRNILKMCYDANLEWMLPEGAPPYKPNPFVDQQGILYTELRKTYLFCKGGGREDISQTKREFLYVQFLEHIDPEDAKLMIAVKDKQMPYKGITKKLVNECWPGLIDEPQKEEVKK